MNCEISEEILHLFGIGGLDTAVVIQALKSQEFFSYETLENHKLQGRKIKEIICKPR